MAFDPWKMLFGRSARADTGALPPDPAQRETIHRLQVGLFGLGTMILLVGLANIIMNSVKDTQASAVPQAAPTVMVTDIPEPAGDPLADAGVVPDLPAEPETEEVAASVETPGVSPAGSASTVPQP
jgi:hypothetical protein